MLNIFVLLYSITKFMIGLLYDKREIAAKVYQLFYIHNSFCTNCSLFFKESVHLFNNKPVLVSFCRFYQPFCDKQEKYCREKQYKVASYREATLYIMETNKFQTGT